MEKLKQEQQTIEALLQPFLCSYNCKRNPKKIKLKFLIRPIEKGKDPIISLLTTTQAQQELAATTLTTRRKGWFLPNLT